MGLLGALVGLPLTPVRGTVWVAERLAEQAWQEMTDPALIRRQLEEIDQARIDGTLGDEEAEIMEDELMQRLLDSTRAGRWEV